VGLAELIIVAILCLGPLALAGVVLLIVLISRGGARKDCPYCGERIRVEATVCRFCGRELAAAVSEEEGDAEQPAPGADSGAPDA
jgi:predicted amidophosphoribosyltransferase